MKEDFTYSFTIDGDNAGFYQHLNYPHTRICYVHSADLSIVVLGITSIIKPEQKEATQMQIIWNVPVLNIK